MPSLLWAFTRTNPDLILPISSKAGRLPDFSPIFIPYKSHSQQPSCHVRPSTVFVHLYTYTFPIPIRFYAHAAQISLLKEVSLVGSRRRFPWIRISGLLSLPAPSTIFSGSKIGVLRPPTEMEVFFLSGVYEFRVILWMLLFFFFWDLDVWNFVCENGEDGSKLEDFEAEVDARRDFPCPYCDKDHDIASLCAHLEDEHSLESDKVTVCEELVNNFVFFCDKLGNLIICWTSLLMEAGVGYYWCLIEFGRREWLDNLLYELDL